MFPQAASTIPATSAGAGTRGSLMSGWSASTCAERSKAPTRSAGPQSRLSTGVWTSRTTSLSPRAPRYSHAGSLLPVRSRSPMRPKQTYLPGAARSSGPDISLFQSYRQACDKKRRSVFDRSLTTAMKRPVRSAGQRATIGHDDFANGLAILVMGSDAGHASGSAREPPV